MRIDFESLLSGLLLAGFVILPGCSPEPVTAVQPAPKVTVRHAEQRELVDYDEYNGWLEATEKVEVRARVRGHIAKVHFTDGQIVAQGALLFELDPEPFIAEIEQAKAKRSIFAAQKDAAAKEQARLEELREKGAASKSQLEKAQADTLSFAAQIAAAEQDVRRKDLDLKYSRITAEIAGRISKAVLTQGNLVNAGGSDPLLTTIYAADPIYAYFNIDERSLRRYARKSGIEKTNFTELLSAMKDRKLPFEFRLESEAGYPHTGELDFIEPRIDRATGTLQGRGVVKNPGGQFVPGSRVQVRIAIAKPYQALLIPDTAVLTDQDKKYLLVVDDKQVVHRRDVTEGKLLDDGMRVVLPGDAPSDGLQKDDAVIVEGLQRARINYPVDPVKG